jgi:hypothetical protein
MLVPSTDDGSEQVVGSLGNQIDVVTIEDEDELNSLDSYNSKVSSVSESIDIFKECWGVESRDLRWFG